MLTQLEVAITCSSQRQFHFFYIDTCFYELYVCFKQYADLRSRSFSYLRRNFHFVHHASDILSDTIIGYDNTHEVSAIFFPVRSRAAIGARGNMVATCIYKRFVICRNSYSEPNLKRLIKPDKPLEIILYDDTYRDYFMNYNI